MLSETKAFQPQILRNFGAVRGTSGFSNDFLGPNEKISLVLPIIYVWFENVSSLTVFHL